MKHLELHIIQSVPVACLNRDDLNSPKTAVFGGVQRARVSSQSWKRAIREMAKESDNSSFNGNRSRRMVSELVTRLVDKKVDKEVGIVIAEHIADVVETLDSKKIDEDGYKKIKTMMFFSDAEYTAIANVITEEIITCAEEVNNLLQVVEAVKEKTKNADKEEKGKAGKDLEKTEKDLGTIKKKLIKVLNNKIIRDAIKSAELKDAADIALFGRMVANDHTLTVEAASMFSHALSTHKVDNEIDFFSAVDDLQGKEEAGAGMTGTLEFNSATYYRFAALNLDMLADKEHLTSMTEEQRKNVVRTFIEATIKAVPSARKNSMNGNTLPIYVLGIVREKGHPVQLINAFEKPVKPNQGYAEKSVELLKQEYEKLNITWGLDTVFNKSIPDVGIKEFLEGMVAHVV